LRSAAAIPDTHRLIEPLTRLACVGTGDAGARATDVQALRGHAGCGDSFLLERSSAEAKPSGRLVLRVAPEGVGIEVDLAQATEFGGIDRRDRKLTLAAASRSAAAGFSM
jgi:hypothetical protein